MCSNVKSAHRSISDRWVLLHVLLFFRDSQHHSDSQLEAVQEDIEHKRKAIERAMEHGWGDNEIIDEELLERLYGLDVKLAG